MDKIKNYSGSITLRIILVMILLVLPLSIWGVVTATESGNIIYEESKNGISGVGTLMMKELDNRIDSVDYYLYDTLLSNTFFFTAKDQKGDEAFYHAVYNLHDTFSSRANIIGDADVYFLYCKKEDYLQISTSSAYNGYQSKLKKAVDGYLNGYDNEKKWRIISVEDDEWLIRCAKQGDMYYGGLIQINNVYEKMKENFLYDTIEIRILNTKTAEAEKQDMHMICGNGGKGIYMHIWVAEKEILRSLPLMQRVGGAISVVFLCLVPILMAFLYFSLLRPINILLKAMNQVQAGTWNYQITETSGSNEFQKLYQNFNHMVVAQNEMSARLVEKETYGKQLELKNLQMQVRPHFLLNSFNLLYGLVEMEKIESAQRMILYLSDYFRYIFRSGKELELYQKELRLILNYIDIARLRYPFIAFQEEHDEKILWTVVPPLMIHNFVENVLKHGLNPGEITEIRLLAHYEEGKAVFQIRDNGRGISADEVKAINSGNFEKYDEKIHVGIMNSYQRIQYFFGEAASLKVASVQGEGTCVTICYPCEL